MDKKAKTRRIRMMALATFVLPLMAIGANLNSQQADNEELHELGYEEMLCGDPAPRDPYTYTGYDAQTIDYYEQPEFVFDYFSNLVDHLPTNNAGNCGYTGLAMLLCYYDTYWNKTLSHLVSTTTN